MIYVYKILRRSIDTARDSQFCKCTIAECNHLYCSQSQHSF